MATLEWFRRQKDRHGNNIKISTSYLQDTKQTEKQEINMAVTISIGSGKGGTGKTMILCNLALILAQRGKKVCLVDLDIGGADAHILFGLFNPKYSLTDFLTRKVDTIQETIHTFYSYNGLQLIPGSGSTLQTANMSFQEKQRLLRSIETLDVDVILIDVGAGTSYHSLDFFMFADIQLCVILPEPTSIMDFYSFLQLATIRKVLSSFLSSSQVSATLKKVSFSSLSEALDLAEQTQTGAKKKAMEALHFFHPLLVVNRDISNGKVNKEKLKKMVSKYLGIEIPSLGNIPEDNAISDALKAYMPICELNPTAPASVALGQMANKIEKLIELFRSTADTKS